VLLLPNKLPVLTIEQIIRGRAQHTAAEAQRTQGIFTAVSAGIASAGETASQASAQMNDVQIAQIEADAKVQSARETYNQLDTGTDTFGIMGNK
jgi:hypothetical protein